MSFEKPETTAQTACSLLIVMSCIATNAIIIGSVTTAISQMNAYDNEELLRRRAITAYLHSHEVTRARPLRILSCPLNTLQTPLGFTLDTLWIPFGYPLDTLWIPFRY